MYRSILVAILALAVLPAAASADEIIVKRDRGLNAAERADLRADAGVRLVETLPLPRTELVRAADVGDALRELNADPDVVYAEPDRPVRAFSNDPNFGFMWGLQNLAGFGIGGVPAVADADMDVIEAWAASTGAGRTVAVVDSGVDAGHPDLAGRVAPGYDWVDEDGDAADGDGHGTHVSGTIAALRDNDAGGVGVAPDARILPLRVLDDTGAGTTSDVVAAFDAAGDMGVRVVNASLGGASFSQAEHDAIASHPGTLYVVAAGNDGADNDVAANAQYPCAYDLANILCVGASTHADEPAGFSNRGATTVDLFAPGFMIWSTLPGGEYDFLDGTSMASPHVAGAAALLLARNPVLTTQAVKDTLMASAEAKPAFAGLAVTGARANAAAALELAGAPICAAGEESCSESDDPDGDGVLGGADACPHEPAPTGCPGFGPDTDADAVADRFDACPEAAGAGAANGCPPAPPAEDEQQEEAPAAPAAPAPAPAPKPAPKPAPTPAPRPAPKPAPAPAPRPPADRDGDGRPDSRDACPTERAATPNGCPVAAIASGSARVRRRAVRFKLGTDRAATLRVVVERRKRRGKRKGWVRVARRTLSASDGTARLKLKRLKRGAHRARVEVHSPAGQGRTRTLRFRVR